MLNMKILQKKAQILSEALPLLYKHRGETFVIKYSGSAMEDPELSARFAEDVVALKKCGINIVIVHGGSVKVKFILDKLDADANYASNIRIANQTSIEIVEMVLSGLMNKAIVSNINKAGGNAIGISGKDCNILEAKRQVKTETMPYSNIKQIVNTGFFGEISMINPEFLITLEETDIIPVISPIASGESGETLEVNSDTVAAAIASALLASKLIFIDDIDQIITNDNKKIGKLNLFEAQKMLNEKAFPNLEHIDKINMGTIALEHNIEAAHIIDGRIMHSLILELLTEDRIGTLIHL
jgi:acetylglutamate kinase